MNYKYFTVNFVFTNGEKLMFNVKTDDYLTVSKKILTSSNGWFGVKGSYINLANVNEVTIDEINIEDSFYSEDSYEAL